MVSMLEAEGFLFVCFFRFLDGRGVYILLVCQGSILFLCQDENGQTSEGEC
jgi:hypothetical protein